MNARRIGLVLLLISVVAVGVAFAQSVIGTYEGYATLEGVTGRMTFRFNTDSTFVYTISAAMHSSQVQTGTYRVSGNRLSLLWSSGDITYFTIRGNTIISPVGITFTKI